MQQTTIAISGMTCGHCVTSVGKALRAIDGLQVDNVSVGSATVTYDPSQVSTDAISKAIHTAGYDVVNQPASTSTSCSSPSGGCCK